MNASTSARCPGDAHAAGDAWAVDRRACAKDVSREAALGAGPALREHQLFFALTVVIGILAGLTAVLFSLSIDVMRDALFRHVAFRSGTARSRRRS